MQNHIPLLEAVQKGYLFDIENLWQKGAENFRDENEETLLMHAARGGDVTILQFLLEKGAKINAKGKNAQTPLMFAVAGGHLAAFQLFVKNKSKLNVKNKNGWTLLMAAAESGNVALVQALIDMGQKIEEHSKDGWTCLMSAAGKSLEIVSLFVDLGADIHCKNRDGWDALLYAVKRNQIEIAQFLLEKGANANTRDRKAGWSAWMYAFANDDRYMQKLLLDYGAVIGVGDEEEVLRFLSEQHRTPEMKEFVQNVRQKSSWDTLQKHHRRAWTEEYNHGAINFVSFILIIGFLLPAFSPIPPHKMMFFEAFRQLFSQEKYMELIVLALPLFVGISAFIVGRSFRGFLRSFCILLLGLSPYLIAFFIRDVKFIASLPRAKIYEIVLALSVFITLIMFFSANRSITVVGLQKHNGHIGLLSAAIFLNLISFPQRGILPILKIFEHWQTALILGPIVLSALFSLYIVLMPGNPKFPAGIAVKLVYFSTITIPILAMINLLSFVPKASILKSIFFIGVIILKISFICLGFFFLMTISCTDILNLFYVREIDKKKIDKHFYNSSKNPFLLAGALTLLLFLSTASYIGYKYLEDKIIFFK